jgi:uncharacterized protein YbgA (DUF1722 family)/uncharacterized protein YbbK (DUF523 family)
MTDKIMLGISSCLLGDHVRYDGSHKLDHYLVDTLGKYVKWVPVCPEVESGLPVPREAMRLVGDPEAPRLLTRKSNIDQTERMLTWSQKKFKELENENLCGFIFKSRSPSSGIRNVKVYTYAGMPSRTGKGIFGSAFIKEFPLLPVEDDGRLHDPSLRENFIERVFVFKRWQDLLDRGAKPGQLVEFHTRHKLMIMAHSQKHYAILGRIIANSKLKIKEVLTEYITLLMDAVKLLATTKKNTNVLMHIMGYFKKQLSSDEKKEMLEVIENYHRGLVPLIVPIVLINHYVSKYDELYLKKQYYLNPNPLELMLRNHV